MANCEELKKMLSEQQQILKKLEQEFTNLSEVALLSEKENIEKELEKLQQDHKKLQAENEKLSDQRATLEAALLEQVYGEKLSILRSTEDKLKIFFNDNVNLHCDRLTSFEHRVKTRLATLGASLHEENLAVCNDLNKKVTTLEVEVNDEIGKLRHEQALKQVVFSSEEKEEFNKIRDEELTSEQITAAVKNNSIESFVGLNLLNKLGILLLIVGFIAFSYYNRNKVSVEMKSLSMFLVGIVMLIGGEFLNRKKSNIFSLGITSGGVAILYVATAVSYFMLGTINSLAAIFACIVISACSFFLSYRYKSQTIASFAIIGGYLPIVNFTGGLTFLYGLMVYLVILNLFSLISAYGNKWRIAAFLGLILNAISNIYLCSLFFRNDNSSGFILRNIIILSYISFAFLVFNLVPILNNYLKKVDFKIQDFVLLSLNTIVNVSIIYYILNIVGVPNTHGLFMVLVAGLFLLLAKFCEKKFTSNINASNLFYIKSLTFLILFIPVQFNAIHISLGWLLEGALLAIAGILLRQKLFEKSGMGLFGFGIVYFFIFDVLGQIDYGVIHNCIHDNLFMTKYSLITVGAFSIAIAANYRKSFKDNILYRMKMFAIVNTWIFCFYISAFAIEAVKFNYYIKDMYLAVILGLSLSMIFACILPKIKVFVDKYTNIYVSVILLISLLIQLIINLDPVVDFYSTEVPMHAKIVATIVMLFMNCSILFILSRSLQWIVTQRIGKYQNLVLVLNIIAFAFCNQILIENYKISFMTMSITLVYATIAIAWIVFGFLRNNTNLRRVGLALSVFSVIKLFIIDLKGLSDNQRIISYFALGLSLIFISYLYQYFSKKIEMSIYEK